MLLSPLTDSPTPTAEDTPPATTGVKNPVVVSNLPDIPTQIRQYYAAKAAQKHTSR